MSPTRCPTCRRALALREDLRGALVRCPLCGATFRAGPSPGRSSGTGWVGWLIVLLALLFGTHFAAITCGTTVAGYFTSTNGSL
jgi:hypothetical protein